jgi:hypothetical protein
MRETLKQTLRRELGWIYKEARLSISPLHHHLDESGGEEAAAGELKKRGRGIYRIYSERGCHLIYISSSGQLFNHLQLCTASGGV